MTAKDNMLMFLRHEIPEWIPNYRQDVQVYAPPEVLERSSCKEGGPDWFGVRWAYEPTVRGFMPDTRCAPFLPDITGWREQVRFPDLNAVDWTGMAERDADKLDPDKVMVVQIVCGLFERLAAMMGMAEANIALVEEPEACRDFLCGVADFHIEKMTRLLEYFPQIAMFEIHDDWGTQISSFMSPKTWKQVIGPAVSKVTAFLKERGKYLHLHSCGRVEGLIPGMIEAGIEHWTSAQSMNDLPEILRTYGPGRTFTVMGGFDIPAWRAPEMTKEKLMPLVEARIDRLCRGGACLPYVALRVPFVNDCITELLEKKKDFYQNPVNRSFD